MSLHNATLCEIPRQVLCPSAREVAVPVTDGQDGRAGRFASHTALAILTREAAITDLAAVEELALAGHVALVILEVGVAICFGVVFSVGIVVGISIGIDVTVVIRIGIGVSVRIDIGVAVGIGITVSAAIAIRIAVGIAPVVLVATRTDEQCQNVNPDGKERDRAGALPWVSSGPHWAESESDVPIGGPSSEAACAPYIACISVNRASSDGAFSASFRAEVIGRRSERKIVVQS